MHILQKLRLCCRRVTAQENVNFASESTSSTMLEFLGDAAEELAQNTFLDIVVLPNAWSKRVNEQLVDVWLFGESLEFFNLLFSEEGVVLVQGSFTTRTLLMTSIFLLHLCVILSLFFEAFTTVVVPSFVSLNVSDDIDIGSINILESSSLWVDTDSHGLVNSSNFNSVTWLNIID